MFEYSLLTDRIAAVERLQTQGPLKSNERRVACIKLSKFITL